MFVDICNNIYNMYLMPLDFTLSQFSKIIILTQYEGVYTTCISFALATPGKHARGSSQMTFNNFISKIVINVVALVFQYPKCIYKHTTPLIIHDIKLVM